MSEGKTQILIVGAGRAGTALLRILMDDPSVRVVGVVDPDAGAPGLKIAQERSIPISGHWGTFFQNGTLDEVVDATGREDVHRALLKEKPGHTIVTGDATARALWFLAKEFAVVDQKIREAKEDVEAHEWGVRKTNEAIKLLYKELEEKNKELKNLDRLKSDFISTVSHELRTPLAITKEGITLIQDGVLGEVSEKQMKVLTTARESIDRLARLIAGLLDISKIEAGKIEITKSCINLTEVARSVAALFEPQAVSKTLELRLRVPDRLVEVYADSDKMIQVFTNLLGNALKFTENGYIEIAVEEKDDEVECSVSDTGRGVTRENIPKMFEKFQQIDREHGDGERGTGLGLTIAKSIVEMHGGRMWAESELGRGTTCLFTLPKYSEANMIEEYVRLGIEEAERKKAKISVIMVRVENIEDVRHLVSEEKIEAVLRGVERVLKENLEQDGGLILKKLPGCLMIVPDLENENMVAVSGRLKQAIDHYLARDQWSQGFKLRFGCAVYPDEAGDIQGLIGKVMGKG